MRPSIISFVVAIASFTISQTLLGQEAPVTEGLNQPRVEMRFCGSRLQKPPLEKLNFRVSLHNPTDQQRWILLPNGLYSHATAQRRKAGISGVEVLVSNLTASNCCTSWVQVACNRMWPMTPGDSKPCS